MAKILITGAAGFIGSNFARYTAEKYPHYEIIGVDNLSPYSCRASIQDLEDKGALKLYVADICDLARMESLYRRHKFDYVVNFAAESHNDRAVLDPTKFALANALGAQSLLEASRRVGVGRHVHVSTVEVYGEQPEGVDYFTEASALNAKTPYSAAKAAGDMLVRAYMQTYRRMDICMTHCVNNYGPRQLPEKLIPLCITNVLQGKKVPLYGDGRQVRDWVHVLDHCGGIDLILHRQGKFEIGQRAATRPEELPIFDISARRPATNREIVELILAALGKPDFDSWIEYVQDRPNHDRKYLINPAKIETQLGFAAGVSLEAGVTDTVRWYVDNEPWWRRVLAAAPELQIHWGSTAVAGLNQ